MKLYEHDVPRRARTGDVPRMIVDRTRTTNVVETFRRADVRRSAGTSTPRRGKTQRYAQWPRYFRTEALLRSYAHRMTVLDREQPLEYGAHLYRRAATTPESE